MRTISVFIILIFHLSTAISQQVKISGNAPDYAGNTLSFHTVDNYISNIETKIGSCKVSPNGDFQVQLSGTGTKLVYIYLGVYKARFYMEPGFSYRIKLPSRVDKTPEETASPFFNEVNVYLSVLEVKDDKGKMITPDKELNMNIILFDEAFNPLYDQLAMDAARRKNTHADSIISSFRKNVNSINRFSDTYINYRVGLLYYVSQISGVKAISNAYFAGKPVQYENDAYMDLFNMTYDKYFMYFGRTREGSEIYDVINKQESISKLKKLLGEDGILPGDSLLELVILKNIHDEFYSDRFSRNALLHLLDSVVLETNISYHATIGRQIRNKITKLLKGFSPPDFQLYNQDNKLVSLESYKGKYVYLIFCTTQNYVCLSQYELLNKLYQVHGKWLQIVIVSADENFNSMRDYRKKNNYRWDFLHYANDADILEKYDVRIFPTCYLIDPEGKLVLSPAPAANENIERALYYELQSKGLWDEYIRKGLIDDRKRTDKRFELDLNIPE